MFRCGQYEAMWPWRLCWVEGTWSTWAGVLCSLPPLLILFGDRVQFSGRALYPQYHKHQHAWNLVIYMEYSNLWFLLPFLFPRETISLECVNPEKKNMSSNFISTNDIDAMYYSDISFFASRMGLQPLCWNTSLIQALRVVQAAGSWWAQDQSDLHSKLQVRQDCIVRLSETK